MMCSKIAYNLNDGLGMVKDPRPVSGWMLAKEEDRKLKWERSGTITSAFQSLKESPTPSSFMVWKKAGVIRERKARFEDEELE